MLANRFFPSLLDPAYGEIGPNTCVGMTGGWASYSWPPAIVLTSVMMIFVLEFCAEQYVERKYALAHSHTAVEDIITTDPGRGAVGIDDDETSPKPARSLTHQQLHSGDQDEALHSQAIEQQRQQQQRDASMNKESDSEKGLSADVKVEAAEERSFRSQIAAFLILEFGVIFHSVIIGLNLGTAGDEFTTLYPVIVFHQSFEGLGIGARMSAIPFPRRLKNLPWLLCAGYGLTTPIAIAIGLGLRTTYNGGSFTANVVSGVLDSISAGILVYTGLVELLARDFLFNPELTKDRNRLVFMVVCVFLGAGIMALLGKWA